MANVTDVKRVSSINARLKSAAEDGDVKRLYELIAEDPYILEYFAKDFVETPLHVAAEKGQTRFALEFFTLKPSLARKLNASGWSPIHVALQNHNFQFVRAFVRFDRSLVRIKGRGGVTVLHHVARIGDAELLAELLVACPSAVEDLTSKRETAVHVAVKNHQLMAFEVLLGWIERVNMEHILYLKDKDDKTVYDIAESTNQTEVMMLLSRVSAKNLEEKILVKILVFSLVCLLVSRFIYYISQV